MFQDWWPDDHAPEGWGADLARLGSTDTGRDARGRSGVLITAVRGSTGPGTSSPLGPIDGRTLTPPPPGDHATAGASPDVEGSPGPDRPRVDVFVELADLLVGAVDTQDFLHVLTRRALDLVDAAQAGLVLADPTGTLHVVASSSEDDRVLGLYAMPAGRGPWTECHEQHQEVISRDLVADADRWPTLVAAALRRGHRSVVAVPLRWRSHVLGALNLFVDAPGGLSDGDRQVAQALADVATIGLVQQPSPSPLPADRVQAALRDRAIIEHAKEVVSERTTLPMDEAFEELRARARSTGTRLHDVATAVMGGTTSIEVSAPVRS